eukprot:15441895-Alexandrium_andersonii.AAC.1
MGGCTCVKVRDLNRVGCPLGTSWVSPSLPGWHHSCKSTRLLVCPDAPMPASMDSLFATAGLTCEPGSDGTAGNRERE